MSGGVGPTGNDIALPEDDAATAASPLQSHTAGRRFLSFRQLNALAVAIVLASSGMVDIEDLIFALCSLPYIYFLASYAFPSGGSPDPPVFVGDHSFLLTAYVSAGAVVGLLLPIAYILHGVFEGDKEGIMAAAPHVFLLACQIFMEGVTFSRRFSLPMRAFVPVLYNGRRMFTLADWLRDEIDKEEGEDHGSVLRLHVGRGLAAVNLIFWGFNLFGFLLPVYIPAAFKRYYRKSLQGKVN